MTESFSLNNRLIVEKYTKEALREDHSRKGFALIAQKTNLKGLKVLVDAKLSDGSTVKAGSIAFFKEEVLHTAPWAAKVWECPVLTQPFIIVDLSQVEMIQA